MISNLRPHLNSIASFLLPLFLLSAATLLMLLFAYQARPGYSIVMDASDRPFERHYLLDGWHHVEQGEEGN